MRIKNVIERTKPLLISPSNFCGRGIAMLLEDENLLLEETRHPPSISPPLPRGENKR